MKKIMTITGLLFALLFGFSTANANEIRPYAGVGVGVFNFDINAFGINDSGNGTGFFGILGADFTENIGAELRVGATGNAGVFATNYKMGSFFSYLVKGQFPVTDDLRIYGLLGGTTANLKTTTGGDWTKTGFSFGAGAQFRINDQFSVSGEYMRYWHAVTFEPLAAADATVDGLSATFDFHF